MHRSSGKPGSSLLRRMGLTGLESSRSSIVVIIRKAGRGFPYTPGFDCKRASNGTQGRQGTWETQKLTFEKFKLSFPTETSSVNNSDNLQRLPTSARLRPEITDTRQGGLVAMWNKVRGKGEEGERASRELSIENGNHTKSSPHGRIGKVQLLFATWPYRPLPFPRPPLLLSRGQIDVGARGNWSVWCGAKYLKVPTKEANPFFWLEWHWMGTAGPPCQWASPPPS